MLEKLNATSRKMKETSRKVGILKIYLLTDSSCVRIKFTGRASMMSPLTFKYLMKFRKVNVNGETYLWHKVSQTSIFLNIGLITQLLKTSLSRNVREQRWGHRETYLISAFDSLFSHKQIRKKEHLDSPIRRRPNKMSRYSLGLYSKD